MLRWAVGSCASALFAAAAQSQPPFNFDAFEHDPVAYIAARYPRDAAAPALRAELAAAGFECRDARPEEREYLVSACERIEPAEPHCFRTWRVAIRPRQPGATLPTPEIAYAHRCSGVIAAPMRPGLDSARYQAAGAELLGGPDPRE
jgi:hypothetical protein